MPERFLDSSTPQPEAFVTTFIYVVSSHDLNRGRRDQGGYSTDAPVQQRAVQRRPGEHVGTAAGHRRTGVDRQLDRDRRALDHGPALTAAVQGSDDSLAFNERGDHGQRLADLGEGRIAAMDEQGIAVSVLALTPPDTQSLAPDDAVRLSRIANETAAEA
ncbi:hypothetical protein ACWD6L_04960 [Micromonospora profundi]